MKEAVKMIKRNNVLIVDDDVANLYQLSQILRNKYRIHAVKDGVSALKEAAKHEPDLILLDLIMPGLNGVEVFSQLKGNKKTKDIPVIFITGLTTSADESEGLALGAVDYIRKPFNETVVKLRVDHQIDIVNLRRGLENAAAKAEREAEAAKAANESKSNFLASMSHEIRTPLSAIIGITNILMQNMSLPEEVLGELDKISASSDLLLGIINDILDLSKIEAGKMDVMNVPYEIANLINTASHLNLMRINDKPIEFELEISDAMPARLLGDVLRIKQILNNLLSNAFKYTDAGEIVLSFDCVSAQAGVVLIISVRDTGHGISEAQQKNIFQEYARLHQDEAHVEGTGLGLNITQRLVQLLGGEIHVESEPRKGSVFTVRIPQKVIGTDLLDKEVADNLRQFRIDYTKNEKEIKKKRSLMPFGKVLIVDDIETNLYVTAGLMNLYRLRVDTAMNGQRAIKKITDGKKYDIIFMDHMMPGMNGVEATRRIRKTGYEGKIVALTANVLAGNDEMFLQSGFDGYISKPIDMEELDATLKKFLCDTRDVTKLSPRLVEAFVRDARKTLSALEKLPPSPEQYEGDEMRLFITYVHGIKSALQTVGEKSLSTLAERLERAGVSQDLRAIAEIYPSFINDFRIVLEKFEDYREEIPFT